MKPIYCIGVSHDTAPVEIREKVAVASGETKERLDGLLELEGVEEAVILSTCNRTEIYVGTSPGQAGGAVPERIVRWLQTLAGPGTELPCFRRGAGEAVEHLFSVASGLDSMVLGETEIFGQVKKAYAAAHSAGATGRVLNQLFQRAFQVGKHVRTNTEITRGATSVGAVGVDLAERIFGDLRHCRILILGAGEISRRTAQSLRSRGASGVIVSNRSYDRAIELASEMDGEAIRFDDWASRLAGVDIIIGSTAAPHAVLHPGDLRGALRARKGKPLFVIDLSVPRDVEPAVGGLPGVYLYDLDTLQRLAQEGRMHRQRQIEICRNLIRAKVSEFFPEWRQPEKWSDALATPLRGAE